MLYSYYFTDRAFQLGFIINSDSHYIKQANSELNKKANFPEFGVEIKFNIEILKEMATVYARLTNQYKFEYQTAFSA